MAFLTEWITQIIIFILVATIIDLLTPNSTMRKYIQLVLGMILILILLTPIFSIFQLDFEKAVYETYEGLFEESALDENMENSIEMQKSEIESTHDAYILEEMAVQLKSLTDDILEEEYDATIKAIDFVFEDEAEKTYEGLAGVIVILEKSSDREGRIKPVDEIIIHSRSKETVDAKEVDEAIVELLREEWELTDKEITVYWEGGTS